MAYKAVLFDLDGTLLNTLPDLQNIVNHTLSDAGYRTLSEEETMDCIGHGPVAMLRDALPEEVQLTEEEFNLLYKKHRENYLKYQNQKTKVFPGVMTLLKELKDRGIEPCIVSNKLDDAVQPILPLYFDDLIRIGVGTRENVPVKPARDLVDIALEQLGLKAEDCIYVGDSDTDIDTGRNSGMEVLSVTWGFRSEDFLKEHGARYLIHDPKEILEFVCKKQ